MTTEAIFQTQLIQKPGRILVLRQNCSDPKSAIKEVLGVRIPDHIEIRTLEENPNELYLVIPPNPSGVIKSEATAKAIW